MQAVVQLTQGRQNTLDRPATIGFGGAGGRAGFVIACNLVGVAVASAARGLQSAPCSRGGTD